MKAFMDKDFLLSTETSKKLFHEYAETMPIVDYHCHINPQEIAEDRKFENITQVWLGGDHYKWRQMRSNGVDEYYITGGASDREKFQKWAETLGKAIGNPLYHWSHLELQRYFGYTGYLNGDTAEEVWNLCNKKLQEDDMSVRNIIRKSNVKLICTTDDPVDDLKWHKVLAEDESFEVKVLPAWRPDKAMNLGVNHLVGKEYQKKNWVMQIHYGCKRDNNTFMYEQLGPDTGYDCINNYAPSAQTADFLNSLIASNELPKTILYSLNPNDNEAIGTILGCFQGTEAAGKIQQGSAWWFNDHKTGMIAQMTSLANLGLLANFVGMLTDSRSFLSYTRHEYFRRILCELIGGWVENGEYPADYKTLKEIVCGISYNNAVDYFGFDL